MAKRGRKAKVEKAKAKVTSIEAPKKSIYSSHWDNMTGETLKKE